MSWDAIKIITGVVITLIVQLMGVAWIAGGVSSTANTNSIHIEKLENKQAELATTSVSNAVTIKYTAARIDDVYSIVLKLWERDR